MNDPLAGLWQTICTHLSPLLSPDAFQRWFSTTRLVSADEKKFCIAVPNQIHQYWIESNYVTPLTNVCVSLLGAPRKLEFVIDPSLMPLRPTEAVVLPKVAVTLPTATAVPALAANDPLNEEEEVPIDAVALESERPQTHSDHMGRLEQSTLFSSGEVAEREPLGITPTRSVKGGSPMSARYTFDGFVPGPSTQFALSTARAVADKPGRIYNPLFIYGASGLGKSHLLQAIAFHLMATRKKAKVIYVTTEDFTNEFIDAVQMGQLAAFRKKYRSADALLIDDIQFLGGKERSQEEFFHTFNALADGQRQIVLTSDRPASEVPRLESRLVSRFEWGTTAEVGPPDLETRLAILRKKMSQWRAPLPEEWVRYVAERITNNIRRLEGALMRLASFVSMGGQEAQLTLNRVEELLRDLLQQENRAVVTVDLIQRMVAEHFDIRLADMTSKRRPTSIAFPRQVAMHLARELTRASFAEIGHAFGGRDHGTVMHACKLVTGRSQDDPQLRTALRLLEAKLKSASAQ